MASAMFGPRITTVFRSRWHALVWSAGVLMTAYCTAGGGEMTIQQAIKKTDKPAAHANPWARSNQPAAKDGGDE
jgi:hypothetical protein